MDVFQNIDDKKNIIDKHRPFEGAMLKELQNYFRIGLTWSSNAIEGNTLTISETKVLLEDGLTAGGKPLRDTFETIGHAAAYDFMFSLLNSKSITENNILTMHNLFYKKIDSENAGKYRIKNVFITGSEYSVCEPEKIENEMEKLMDWISDNRGRYHVVEFAALLHKKFVFIHPFIDGNGRLARLLMNTALIQDRYMPALVPPVLRAEYISLLERAHENDRDFINFVADRVLESEKDVIRLLNLS